MKSKMSLQRKRTIHDESYSTLFVMVRTKWYREIEAICRCQWSHPGFRDSWLRQMWNHYNTGKFRTYCTDAHCRCVRPTGSNSLLLLQSLCQETLKKEFNDENISRNKMTPIRSGTIVAPRLFQTCSACESDYGDSARFKSFWNIQLKFAGQDPYELTEPCPREDGNCCRNSCPQFCLNRGRFHNALASLGRTSLSAKERDLLGPNDPGGRANLQNQRIKTLCTSTSKRY